MKIFVIFVILSMFLFSACAEFQFDYAGKTPKEVEEEYQAFNEGEMGAGQVTCKYEKPIGSNISRKVCKSKADRKKRQLKDQQELDSMQRHSGLLNNRVDEITVQEKASR
ncbi:MAG: hypothetical protein QNJ97_10950 [Myxococcota bacterium]|nr:hypothetical protein [Myxococcota bacterium]